MKIIDLLNKITNGEEVPKRIKFCDRIYEFDEDLGYREKEDGKNTFFTLIDRIEINSDELKRDVEVVEEMTDFQLSFEEVVKNLKEASEHIWQVGIILEELVKEKEVEK